MASQSGHNDTGISSPVELGDLPSKRLLGKGLASIGYETEVNGERFARKDFIGVPSGLFEKEAAVLVGLEDHKNIVKTLGWTVDKTSCSLVVEYVDENLLGLLRKRKQSQGGVDDSDDDHHPPPFELHEAVDIMLQIASGMEYLHDHGILHGDLKTKNILVNNCNGDKNSLSVKVADFGLIRTKRKSMSFVSRQARKRDMVRWKAPEILEPELLLSKDRDETSSESDSDESTVGSLLVINWRQLSADVYSFAVICSQILTGEDPYPNDLNWKEWGADIVARELRPTLPAACPPELRTLLNSCWGMISPESSLRPTFSYIRRALEHLVPSRQMALPVRTHSYLDMDRSFDPADEVMVVTALINTMIDLIKSRTRSYEDLQDLRERLEVIQLDVVKIEVQLWVLRKKNLYIQSAVGRDSVKMVEAWLTTLQHALYLTVGELQRAYPDTISHYSQLGSVDRSYGSSLMSRKILEHAKEIIEFAKNRKKLEQKLNNLLLSYYSWSLMQSGYSEQPGQFLQIHQTPSFVFLELLFVLLNSRDREILKEQFRLVLHPIGLRRSIENLEMFKLHERLSSRSTYGSWPVRPSYASSGRPYSVDPSSYASSGRPYSVDPSSYASSGRPYSVDPSSYASLGRPHSIDPSSMKRRAYELDKVLSQDFGHRTSLNTGMFLQQAEEEEGREEVGKLRATKRAAVMRLQYRSHSGGTTSSSVSSLEDSPVKLSVDSLEASASQCHNYAISSARSTTMGAPHHVHDIQQAMIRHMQDEEDIYMDMDASLETGNAIMLDSSGAMLQNISPTFHGEPELLLQATSSRSSPPFKRWRRAHVVPRRSEGSTHQCLLRRCFEFLRHIPRVETHAGSSGQQNFGLPAPRLTSSSSPEPLPEHDPFDEVGPSRWQKQPRGGARIGTPGHPDHDEAAKHHLMKERHRRMRQKKNFADLRRLLPISSKNDKISILDDTIIHSKNLQVRIQELEANMAEMASQHEKLKLSHEELQERNKQLEAMAWFPRNLASSRTQLLLTRHGSLDAQQGEASDVLSCNNKFFHACSQCLDQRYRRNMTFSSSITWLIARAAPWLLVSYFYDCMCRETAQVHGRSETTPMLGVKVLCRIPRAARLGSKLSLKG